MILIVINLQLLFYPEVDFLIVRDVDKRHLNFREEMTCFIQNIKYISFAFLTH